MNSGALSYIARRSLNFVCLTLGFFVLSFFITISPVAAQEVYSWKDRWGRVHYGTKPPAGARDQQKLSGVVSRYSSDKLLRTRRSPSNPASSTQAKSTARASYKGDSAIDPAGEARLEQSSFVFEQDEEQKVVACQVTLKNSGDGSAENLYVAFHFPDGSLVPAIGPQSIAANAEANFTLPQEMLPLGLEQKKDGSPAETSALPELVVHLTNGQFVGMAAESELKADDPEAGTAAEGITVKAPAAATGESN